MNPWIFGEQMSELVLFEQCVCVRACTHEGMWKFFRRILVKVRIYLSRSAMDKL